LRKDNTAALESICSAIWDDAMWLRNHGYAEMKMFAEAWARNKGKTSEMKELACTFYDKRFSLWQSINTNVM
jgi:hypothetical protein